MLQDNRRFTDEAVCSLPAAADGGSEWLQADYGERCHVADEVVQAIKTAWTRLVQPSEPTRHHRYQEGVSSVRP